MKTFVVALSLVFLGFGTPLSSRQIQSQTSVKDNLQEENKKIAEQCEVEGQERPASEVKAKLNVLCGKAIYLPKPIFPEDAKAAKASGVVAIDIVIDEEGRVIWAKAIKGNELLRRTSVRAACRSRFSPTKIADRAVKASGIITYTFVKE